MNNYKIIKKNNLNDEIIELNKIIHKMKLSEEETTQILLKLDNKIHLLREELNVKNIIINDLKKAMGCTHID